MYKIIGADHKEYGPVSAEQLRQWYSEGRVNGATRVQPEGTGIWKPMSEWPEFASLFPSTPSPSGPLPSIPPPVSLGSQSAHPVTNKMALWSMGLGIFCFVFFWLCCWPLGPLPVILGFVALSQIKANPHQTGEGFAITGIVTGALATLLGIVGVIVAMRNPDLMQTLQHFQDQLNNH